MNKKTRKKKIPYINTDITPEKTQAEIKKLLEDHGIEDIQWTTYHGQTYLEFIWHLELGGVQKEISFRFTLPTIPSTKRSWTGLRYENIIVNLLAPAYRLLWHYLKNKLDSVEWGLETMEKEFFSHAVVALPSGEKTTIGDQIGKIYEQVSSPALEHTPLDSKIVEAEIVSEETDQ